MSGVERRRRRREGTPAAAAGNPAALSGPFGSRQRPEMRKTAATGSSPFWDGRRFLPLNFRIDSPSHWGIRELAAMLKKLLAVSAGLLFALTVYAATVQTVEWAEQHPDRYIVRKGDTLWDISARFLKKPWLWPEIWQDNPQVRNPHLIYPGDELVLSNGHVMPRPGLDRAACARHLARRCGQADSAVRAEAVPQATRASSARTSSSTRRTSSASRKTSCAARRASSPTCAASTRSRASKFAIVRAAGRYYDMPPRGEGQPREVYRQTSDWFDGRPGLLWSAWSGRVHDGRQRALPRLRSARSSARSKSRASAIRRRC